MKSFLGLFGAHVMVALAMATSMCQADTCSFSKDAFANEIETGELPGVISVFYDNGREEISCLGYSDVEAKRPITLDDPFQQCSQTKGFCGVTVAMLVEEGKLKLDDPVLKFIPEFGSIWVCVSDTNGVRQLRRAKNILTVRMCLNHTSGLPFELPGFGRPRVRHD